MTMRMGGVLYMKNLFYFILFDERLKVKVKVDRYTSS